MPLDEPKLRGDKTVDLTPKKRGRPLKRHANRGKLRTQELRKYLSMQCTVRAFMENIKLIEGLDPDSRTFINDLAKLKTANDQRIKLINKYLPDLKSVDIQSEDAQGLTIEVLTFANTNSVQLATAKLPASSVGLLGDGRETYGTDLA